MYRAYLRFGVVVFRVWAAVVGCDISVSNCGISGVGTGAAEASLETMLEDDSDVFDVSQFALLLHSNSPQKAILATRAEILSELHRIIKWFASDGQFYDGYGNIISVGSSQIMHSATLDQTCHMEGRGDPKSYRGAEALPDASQCKVDSYKAADAYHN